MAALSGESVAQILYQAGFRGQDLINMLAISKRESGWTPDAHRTDQDPSALSGDLGLFQINYTNWDLVSRTLGLTSKTQLFDPLINARAAKVLFDASGLSPWTMGSNGWAAGGDPFKGTNVGEATQIVNSLTASGAISPDYQGGAVATSGAPATDNGPITIPSDMTIIAVRGGDGVERLYAIKQIAPGVHISYTVPFDGTVQFDGSRVQFIDQATSDATYGRGIMAGDAAELAGVTRTFGTFGAMWDSIVGQVMGYNNPAKDDPEVLAVLAEYAGRPDMSEAELQNKLQATSWYQGRTSSELEWNSLSQAERQSRLDETASRMVSTVFQFAGADVDPSDPRVANHLEAVASGRLGFGAWTQIIKDSATADPESPWSRQVRDEQESQRQRPIDIENTAQRVREATERWGVQWSAETISKWAKDMVEKRSSDEDLTLELRAQAQVLYPWKSPEVESATAAAPLLETYRRVMEESATINTPDVQRALVAGQGVFDFETSLKKTDKWLGTKNGRDTMYATISEMGQRMGYV
jgi:hypothetical protein